MAAGTSSRFQFSAILGLPAAFPALLLPQSLQDFAAIPNSPLHLCRLASSSSKAWSPAPERLTSHSRHASNKVFLEAVFCPWGRAWCCYSGWHIFTFFALNLSKGFMVKQSLEPMAHHWFLIEHGMNVLLCVPFQVNRSFHPIKIFARTNIS